MHIKTAIVALTVSAACITASAETLGEKDKRVKAEENLMRALKGVQKDCGVTIAANMDWDTFKFDDKHVENTAGGMCGSAISQIAYICRRSANGRAAVQQKVKHVTCRYTDPENHTMANGTFLVGFNFKNVAIADRVVKALQDLL